MIKFAVYYWHITSILLDSCN